jgi:ABC-type branched-subunit amino acid transport system ATPase component
VCVYEGPISALLGCVIRKPDTLVLSIPGLTFLLLLPGLLYSTLAFDISRTFFFELLLSCNPVSACAMLLQLVSRAESIRYSVSWTTSSPTASVPVYIYIVMQLADLIVLSVGVSYFIHYLHPNTSHISASARISNKEVDLESSYTTTTRHTSAWNSMFMRHMCSCIYFPIYCIRLLLGYEVRSTVSTAAAYSPIPSPSTATSPSSNIALHVDSLTKQYTTNHTAVTTLSNISTRLQKSCVTVLLGGNGAGKTTMLKILAGLDSKYVGQVTVDRSILDSDRAISTSTSTSATRRILGWCPQNDPLYDLLTVEEHIYLFEDILAASSSTESVLSICITSIIDFVWLILNLGHVYTTTASRRSRDSSVTSSATNKILSELALVEHASKLSSELSGELVIHILYYIILYYIILLSE